MSDPYNEKPYTKQYARRAKHFIPLPRDPFYMESVHRSANPEHLISCDEWFAQHPGAEFRLVACHWRGWFDFTFYPREPRWAHGYQFFGTNLRDALAMPQFKNGTPRERLTRIFRQLKSNGLFVDPFK